MRVSTNGPWNLIYDTALLRGWKICRDLHSDRKRTPRFTWRVPPVWRFNGPHRTVRLLGLHIFTFLPSRESISLTHKIYVWDLILMLTLATVKYKLPLGAPTELNIQTYCKHIYIQYAACYLIVLMYSKAAAKDPNGKYCTYFGHGVASSGKEKTL